MLAVVASAVVAACRVAAAVVFLASTLVWLFVGWGAAACRVLVERCLVVVRWAAVCVWFCGGWCAVGVAVAVPGCMGWAVHEWLRVKRLRDERSAERLAQARLKAPPGHAVALPEYSPNAASPDGDVTRSPLRGVRKRASRATGVSGFFGGGRRARASRAARQPIFEDEVLRVQETLPDGPLRDLVHASNWPAIERQLWPGDSVIAYCRRFLSASGGDVRFAVAAIERDLDWRDHVRPKEVIERGDDLARVVGLTNADVKRLLPCWVQGEDRRGRPLVVAKCGRVPWRELFRRVALAKVQRYAALFAEDVVRACGARGHEAFTLVVDLDGLGLQTVACATLVPFLADVHDTHCRHHPDRLADVMVVNAPPPLLDAYAVLAPWLLDDAARAVVSLHGRDGWQRPLHDRVHPDQLPRDYGGAADDKLDEAWPTPLKADAPWTKRNDAPGDDTASPFAHLPPNPRRSRDDDDGAAASTTTTAAADLLLVSVDAVSDDDGAASPRKRVKKRPRSFTGLVRTPTLPAKATLATKKSSPTTPSKSTSSSSSTPPQKLRSASFNFGRRSSFAPTEAPPPSASGGRTTPPPPPPDAASPPALSADFATFESPPDGLQHRPLVDPLA